MLLEEMHPEDVKAALRKRFGSIRKFVKVEGLPETGVSDLFRGRTSKRVRDAVEAALSGQGESIGLDSTYGRDSAHRLIENAK